MPKPFTGKIELDVRDSKPDWDAFLADRSPDGAPNVLVVLYDDTGQAAWSPYGGRIEMPTMDRLAANGLTYSQWHTTALCSPTRSTFLTGRNHHLNGFASISESSTGFPGYSSHIPPENVTMAHLLRDAGWATFWVGKNHNVPIDEWTMGASKKNWPLAQGYDRFYGFIGGETNNWYPSLAEDNHYVEQPSLPEDGYHLSKDLAGRPTLIQGKKQLLFGGMGRLTENSVLMMKNTSFSLTAQLVVPDAGAEGVIVAQGGVSGGHSLYAKDGKPKYAYNFFGLEQYIVEGTEPIPAGSHQVRMEFTYDGGGVGKGGTVTLYIDGVAVGEGRVEQTEAFLFSADETCDVGNEFGSPVTTDYTQRRFTGEVEWVEIELGLDDHNHLIRPEDRLNLAMGMQ